MAKKKVQAPFKIRGRANPQECSVLSRTRNSEGRKRSTDIGLPRNSTIFNIILEASAAVIPRNESDEES